MKQYTKNIFREVQHSFGRFLSIFAIVALGTGFLAGLAATSPDMMDSVDRYYDESRMPDLSVLSTLGLTEADVQAIADVEGIADVMPAYRMDLLMQYTAEETLAARLLSFPQDEPWLNRFTILEGTLPQNADECAVVRLKNVSAIPEVGSTLTIHEDSETEGILQERTLTVTAIVDSAYYFSTEKESTYLGNGTVNMVLYLPESAFVMDCYTEIFMTLDGAAELDTFGDAYKTLSDTVQERVKDAADAQCKARYDELYTAAEAELADGQTEYDARKREAEEEFAKAEAELAAAKAEIDAQEAEMDAQVNALIQSGHADQSWYLKEQLGNALGDAKAAYTEQRNQFEVRKAESEQALAEAEQKLLDGEQALAALDAPVWYVQSREDNLSYASFDGNSRKVAAIAVVFPVFFFMVAALVSLTAMTRMVEEQQTQIGTLKALGYSRFAIAMKYLLYAASATVLGSAVGLSIGMQLFPNIIWNCYGMMYNLPTLYTPFRWEYALLVFGAVLVCMVGAALAACWVSLQESAASLMLPKAPKAGKRVLLEYLSPIWKRMRFTHKVTVRNLMRYKKRFFMTIIGIAGCTALLLTGFGLSDSINAITERQYGRLNHYDMLVMCRDTEDAELQDILKEAKTVVSVHQESCDITANQTTLEANLFVPEHPEELPQVLTLQNRKSGNPLTLTEEGIILTEKAAETMGISAGDTLSLQNGDGRTVELPVTGIAENYVYTYVYMHPQLYADTFGTDTEYPILLVTLDMELAEQEDFAGKVLECGSVGTISLVSSIETSFRNMVTSIDYIVLVLILCAGLLAFVVLYNLMDINITERERELATIKVLGFHEHEVGAYIYRETLLLSLFGTVVGLFVGIFLHAFVIRTAEVDVAMFGREIAPSSFLYAAVLTMVFSLLVCLMMFPKLKKIDMVSSLKSVD